MERINRDSRSSGNSSTQNYGPYIVVILLPARGKKTWSYLPFNQKYEHTTSSRLLVLPLRLLLVLLLLSEFRHTSLRGR